jgi:hypothetical protein
VKALIIYDSTDICIKSEDKIINRYHLNDDYYLLDVFYDRITGLISFNKCHPIEPRENKKWSYELIVWDFTTNKTWVIDSGESRDGEGFYISHMCNYDPSTRSGFMITTGWESIIPQKYIYGKAKEPVSLSGDFIYLVSIINEDSILVRQHRLDRGFAFYAYNFKTEQTSKVDYPKIYDYSKPMLYQFGINLKYLCKPVKKRLHVENGDWNPDGNLVMYFRYDSNRKIEYYIYDIKNDHQWLVSTNQKVIPIWK